MAYVVVTVSFSCPFCSRISVEHLIAETGRFDRDEVATTLSQQFYECQLCSRPMPDGTSANAHAELATLDRLKELGFPSPRHMT